MLNELAKSGISQRESALRAIRDLENNELEIIDLHPNPWKAASVLAWITKVLQSLADWRPGAKPSTLQYGAIDYLSNLRFQRVTFNAANKSSPKGRVGAPPKYDWVEGKQYVFKLLRERGDPDEADQTDDWCRQEHVVKAVQAHLSTRSVNGASPSDSVTRTYVKSWLDEYRSQN